MKGEVSLQKDIVKSAIGFQGVGLLTSGKYIQFLPALVFFTLSL
jgi:hypothetical protein